MGGFAWFGGAICRFFCYGPSCRGSREFPLGAPLVEQLSIWRGHFSFSFRPTKKLRRWVLRFPPWDERWAQSAGQSWFTAWTVGFHVVLQWTFVNCIVSTTVNIAMQEKGLSWIVITYFMNFQASLLLHLKLHPGNSQATDFSEWVLTWLVKFHCNLEL